ncbi:hypothetical protein D3C80_931330 [compost metagenome]
MNNLNLARLNLYRTRERIQIELEVGETVEGLLKSIDWKHKTIRIHRPKPGVDWVLQFSDVQTIAPHSCEATELDVDHWGLSWL